MLDFIPGAHYFVGHPLVFVPGSMFNPRWTLAGA